MTLGNRILRRSRCATPGMIAGFDGLPVANVGDCMSRLFGGGARLRPYHGSGAMAGPALTVRTRPGDNLMLHKAIDMAEPGDVIVVDGGGHLDNALMGELMLLHAQRRGVAGFVLDGAVRDVEAIRRIGLPVFAAGVTHRGPFKDGPGEINVPVSLDGMPVVPGDVVLGDSDGVLAVPLDEAEAIRDAARAKLAAETAQIEAIRQGTNDRSWVDRALKANGCEMPD